MALFATFCQPNSAVLVTKNAIRGSTVVEVAIEAARLRLRPIMMISFAFILGIVPRMNSTGTGAELQQVIGTTVFSGMLGVTFFGLAFNLVAPLPTPG